MTNAHKKELKNTILTLRLTSKEKIKLILASKKENMTVTTFVRKLILDKIQAKKPATNN